MTPVDRVTTPDDWLRTADRHATGNVPVASPRDEIAQVVAALPGRRFDSASVVAVVDDARLVGVVTIERLLAAPLTASVADVMDADPPPVAPHTNQEHAAWRAVQHGEPGVAVVDDA